MRAAEFGQVSEAGSIGSLALINGAAEVFPAEWLGLPGNG
jgi:hypothetical protein